MAPKGSTLTPAQARLRQQYLNWLKWWKSTVSSDDYLKFVAQKVKADLHIHCASVQCIYCVYFNCQAQCMYACT